MDVDSKIEKCRACLVDNAAQLFDWNALPDNFPENQSYLQIFTACTRIDASPPDLPQKLCYGCASQLRLAFLLIRKCRESDLLLRVKQEKLIASQGEFISMPAYATKFMEERQPAGIAAQEYEEPMDFRENEYLSVSEASAQENQEFIAASHDFFPTVESESRNSSVTIKEESQTSETDGDAMGLLRSIFVRNAQLDNKLSRLIGEQEQVLAQLNSLKAGNCMPAMPTAAAFETFQQIDTIEDIISFEKKLQNEKFVKDMLLLLSSVCGKNSGLAGKDICYKLVDVVFTRRFFTLVSMTGVTRGGVAKENFSQFSATFRFFLKLVNRSDPNWSEVQLRVFFQSCIDNSKRRYTQIMTNKPKRASYSKHQKIARKRLKNKIDECSEESSNERTAVDQVASSSSKAAVSTLVTPLPAVPVNDGLTLQNLPPDDSIVYSDSDEVPWKLRAQVERIMAKRKQNEPTQLVGVVGSKRYNIKVDRGGAIHIHRQEQNRQSQDSTNGKSSNEPSGLSHEPH